MEKIHFSNPHRKKHFEFFREMNHPHFNVTVPVDITAFLERIKDMELSFNFSFVYFITRAANEVREFRWRIRGEDVIEHKTVNPSFTVPTEETDVFSSVLCHTMLMLARLSPKPKRSQNK